jgi:hypothetical protein
LLVSKRSRTQYFSGSDFWQAAQMPRGSPRWNTLSCRRTLGLSRSLQISSLAGNERDGNQHDLEKCDG